MSRIVFVLGMHRSGTSLTTGIMSALGVPLGDELIPPDANNRMGYFESPSVGRIHDGLLRALGSSWYSPMTVAPLPERWWQLPAVQPFKAALLENAARQLALGGGTWAFKDPRTSRLLPLWREIAAELGAESRYVLVVRNPHEVARSLHSRDGISVLRAEMLWLEHTVEPLLDASQALNAIVDYDRWFRDPHEQARALAQALDLQADDEAVDAAVRGMIAPDLRHHRTPDASYSVPLVRDLYEALCARDAQRIQLLVQIFSVTRVFAAAALALAREPEPQVTAGV